MKCAPGCAAAGPRATACVLKAPGLRALEWKTERERISNRRHKARLGCKARPGAGGDRLLLRATAAPCVSDGTHRGDMGPIFFGMRGGLWLTPRERAARPVELETHSLVPCWTHRAVNGKRASDRLKPSALGKRRHSAVQADRQQPVETVKTPLRLDSDGPRPLPVEESCSCVDLKGRICRPERR